jgi:hypothetical protein
MDDPNAIGVIDDTHFQRLTVGGRSDEHRDVGIVGLESSPVVSECVEHVVIGDTPRLRALASMSAYSDYASHLQASTSVDGCH